jgi:DNA modification methylase
LRDPWTGQGLLFPDATPSHILPTHTTADRHPVHRWFGFVAGFSPEYVRACISEAGLGHEDRVLDPFVGCGTTLVEANATGIRSVGFEPHPFFADVCRAKLLVEMSPDGVREIQDLLTSARPRPIVETCSPEATTFLQKLIPNPSLAKLIGARVLCETLGESQALVARLILSRVLDLCSHAKTDGIYKAPTSKKLAADYDEALARVCSMIAADLAAARSFGMTNRAQLLEASAEDMSKVAKGSCSLLITSPPYLNNFDFAEMTRMYLYFWGYAGNWGEISARVRSKLIVNTTTALKGHRDRLLQYRAETPPTVWERLDGYRDELAVRRQTKAGKKEYDRLIYPYFAQMTRVARSAARALKATAAVRIILADAALYGVHIKTHEVLADILASVGYEKIQIRRLRERGKRWVLDKRQGADEGLGEYEIMAAKSQDGR